MKAEIVTTKKDHYIIIIDGIATAEMERSQVRELISLLDNKI
jgi:predicted transcriptional regulator of viral defense system